MSTLVLLFTKDGTAVLEEEDEPTWASDDDEDFAQEMGPGKLDIEDATRILVYLVEQDIITESESQLCSIEDDDGDGDDNEDVIDADFEEVPSASSH